MATPPDREPTRPLPTLGGVAAGNNNAPSADRIVCRGRAGEGVAPPRASVSDSRQPTEREEAAAVGGPATSQGGVWIRIASSGRADVPGQRTVSSASLAWRAVCLLADAPMLPGWQAAGRGHWAQLRRDLGRCCTVLGARPQAKVRYVPGGSCWWWRLATYRLRGTRTALSGGRLTDARLRGRSPRFVA
jgi:hypothetical protein